MRDIGDRINLKVGWPMRFGKMRGQDTDKGAVARDERSGLNGSDTCALQDRGAEPEFRVEWNVLNNDRFAALQCARTGGAVSKVDAFEKIQEFVVKAALCLYLKITGMPIHELDVAEF